VEPSDEIKEALLEMTRCHLEADGQGWAQLWSRRSGVLSVGSDPREWYEEHEQITSLSSATFEARGAAGYVVDRCVGVQEGSVGWGMVECHTEWNGHRLPHAFRLSAVFHLERGRWKLCHSHRSFAILDDELWGFDLSAVLDSVSDDVRRQRPNMKEVAAPNGTVTILFTDIEGSTRLTQALGDGAWMDLLRKHNAIVREQAAANAGYEVKSQGDGFMLAFGSAGHALRCASGIQRSLASLQAGEPSLRVRIGVHTGEAIHHEDDFFGTSVILAARIAATARGAEVLVSSLVRDLVEGSREFSFEGPTQAELKGLTGVHALYSLAWRLSGEGNRRPLVETIPPKGHAADPRPLGEGS